MRNTQTPVFTLHFYKPLLGTMRNTQTPFHASFWPSQTLPTPLLGTMKHPTLFSCFIFGLPQATLGNHEAPKPLFMLHFCAFPNLFPPTLVSHEAPTPPFHASFLAFPRPFPPHACEPWSTQTLFHASFWAFPSPSHPTLGNHEAPKPLLMLHASWFPRVLGTKMKHEKRFGCFMVPKMGWVWGSQNDFWEPFWAFMVPTPLLGTMKHPTPFSCFFFSLPRPFPDPFMLGQVCLGKWRFPKTSWRRTCFVVFVKYAWWSAVLQKQAEREHALSSIPDGRPVCKNMLKENMLCRMPGEMPFCKISWKRTCFVKYAWWNAVLQNQAEREHALSFSSSMPGEMPFCKNKLKENMLCRMPGEMSFCKISWKRTCFVKYAFVKLWQVSLVKCRFAKRSWKRTCFVKSAWWNIEREHAWSSMSGEMPFSKSKLKENMLCPTLSSMPGEMPFCKKKLKENMSCHKGFVKYAWWSAVLHQQAKREHALSSMPGEILFCKISWKRTCFVKYAWWNAVLQNEAEREHALSSSLVKYRKRKCLFKYVWGNAVFQKQAEREHSLSSLSSMPGEMPFCRTKLKENMFCHLCQVCLVKCRFATTS